MDLLEVSGVPNCQNLSKTLPFSFQNHRNFWEPVLLVQNIAKTTENLLHYLFCFHFRNVLTLLSTWSWIPILSLHNLPHCGMLLKTLKIQKCKIIINKPSLSWCLRAQRVLPCIDQNLSLTLVLSLCVTTSLWLLGPWLRKWMEKLHQTIIIEL